MRKRIRERGETLSPQCYTIFPLYTHMLHISSAKQCISHILHTLESHNKGQIWNKFCVLCSKVVNNISEDDLYFNHMYIIHF